MSISRESIEELNNAFRAIQITNIEPWIKHATEMDRDGDIYLNRIYRLYIANESKKDVDFLISEPSFAIGKKKPPE